MNWTALQRDGAIIAFTERECLALFDAFYLGKYWVFPQHDHVNLYQLAVISCCASAVKRLAHGQWQHVQQPERTMANNFFRY